VVKGGSMHSCLCLSSLEPKKSLVFRINGMLCYFPPSVILQWNAKVFGKNVDKTKVEVRAKVQSFLNETFQKFHIAIWSCMKLEDVLGVVPMFMPESLLDQSVFIQGHE